MKIQVVYKLLILAVLTTFASLASATSVATFSNVNMEVVDYTCKTDSTVLYVAATVQRAWMDVNEGRFGDKVELGEVQVETATQCKNTFRVQGKFNFKQKPAVYHIEVSGCKRQPITGRAEIIDGNGQYVMSPTPVECKKVRSI